MLATTCIQFSTSYHDLRLILDAYANCDSSTLDLEYDDPRSWNKIEYLIYRITDLLDQGNFKPEQLANLARLASDICRADTSQYELSPYIDLELFVDPKTSVAARCQAIDVTMDAMYPVFRRSMLDKSVPLDFSIIQFHADPSSNETATYNLTELINTTWLLSPISFAQICKITDSIKEYVEAKMVGSQQMVVVSNLSSLPLNETFDNANAVNE